MARRFAWVTALVLTCVCARYVLAEGGWVRVTKQTQAQTGLRYTLNAERVSPEVVMVRMDIPRDGKLKNLRGVGLSLGKRTATDEGSPALSAPLQTRPGKDGSQVAAFQLSPELAERCAINLTISDDTSGFSYNVYSVELKGYITDRK